MSYVTLLRRINFIIYILIKKAYKGGNDIISKILDMIYPPVCGFCGKLDKNSLCNKCKIRIQKNAICKIEDYRETTSYFDEHIYLFQYDGEIRDAILNFKFNEQAYLYRTFIRFIKTEKSSQPTSLKQQAKNRNFYFSKKQRESNNFSHIQNKEMKDKFSLSEKNIKKICAQIKKYDIIIPIPISKKRFKQRGYNQSAIIANNLAKTFNIEYKENVLVKIKDNKPQSELGQNERSENVKGIYMLKDPKQIYQKKILLIDDIFTTGSTANECTKVLKENFATKVGIFTLAKD